MTSRGSSAVTEPVLATRIEAIERGYEYLLAYAAQGRQDDAGTELRATLTHMHQTLTAMQGGMDSGFDGLPPASGVSDFTDTVERDVKAARGAISAWCCPASAITSLLVTISMPRASARVAHRPVPDRPGGQGASHGQIMRTAITERMTLWSLRR